MSHPSTPTPPAARGRGQRHLPVTLDGAALAELGQRVRAIVATLTARSVIERTRDYGDSDRVKAALGEVLTVPVGKGQDAPMVSLSIVELGALAELADATADAQGTAQALGSRGTSITHVVPDTMTSDARGEYGGGMQVTAAWIRPGDALSPSAGFSRMAVTLTATSNGYLSRILPVDGELQVHEMSRDGRVVVAGFRQVLPGGQLGTEVPAPHAEFTYR